MENLNVVNDTQEPVVEVQETADAEVVESVQEVTEPEADSEVTTEQKQKSKQSREDNAIARKVRQKAAQEAEDAVYERLFGEEHNIHSKAEYEAAERKFKEAALIQKAKESDNPEDIINQMVNERVESDPRIKEYETLKKETFIEKELATLNSDLKEIGLDTINSVDDIAKLPSGVKAIEYIKQGRPLTEAYFLANKAEIIKAQAEKIQKETLEKTQKLKHASPGALDSTKGSEDNSIFSLSKKDFDKMKEDVLMGRRK